MPFHTGLWMYAWDLRDEGVDTVLGFARDSGLNALHIAGAYHAGWFIHPHNPKHRAYFPEDGVVYFHASPALYQDTIINPKVAEVCRETDWFAEAGKNLDRYGLRLVSWTVCCHNTRIGLAYPQVTVRNVYGDSYPHALCPANDEVRRYLVALCRDLATNYPLHAVQLEAPSYMGLQHGHHHERDLSLQGPLERALLNLCFCRACVRKAGSVGIDAYALRVAVREHLDAVYDAVPGRPPGSPATIGEFGARHPDLEKFNAFRAGIEDSLLHEIKAGLARTRCEVHLLGGYRPETAAAVDVYSASVYGLKHGPARDRVAEARAATPAEKGLHAGIRLGLDATIDSVGELADVVGGVRHAGATGVVFYNYSESPMPLLRWIKPALAMAL